MRIVEVLSKEFQVDVKNIQNVIELLDSGNTIPFIARYRKEMTGELDEEKLRNIKERLDYLRNLENRKKEVINLISKQGKLTQELKTKIEKAQILQEVEDLYRPFKPKRKTRASKAKAKGLEPLAQLLLNSNMNQELLTDAAGDFVNKDKGVESVEEALQGARDILAEQISDSVEIRNIVREFAWREGVLSAEGEGESNYRDYYDYSEPVKSIPPHRILAINRGEREKFLKVKIILPDEKILARIKQLVLNKRKSSTWSQVEKAVEDGYSRLIVPSIQREIRRDLTEKAEDKAIQVFSRNLKSLLLQPPIKGRNVLGIDPAYRTGCKVAVVDATGKLLETAVIYPTPPQKDIQGAEKVLTHLIQRHNVSLIAIGNGTACRETEMFVAEVISNKEDLYYMIVNEAGASVYSASPQARDEFPNLDVSLRGAVSIARRVLDPLAELVKIPPRSIGVGQYQHDVDQKKLSQTLDGVVESCVNSVGVDLNTASVSLLSYVAGISKKVAGNIVSCRDEKGRFTSRDELLKISGLGDKTFTQCAGFLRISDGENPLDNTPIHPESYSLTCSVLKEAGYDLNDLKTRPYIIREAVKTLNPTKLAEKLGGGVPTIRDILLALEKPGRDPREDMPKPLFMKNVLELEDLKQDMVLMGSVTNVVDFGAFVDIGVGRDGLVHISQMSEQFIKHPLDVVSVGDHVRVKVMEVDLDRGRISLSMKGVD